MQDFPVRTDWMLQDFGLDAQEWFIADDNGEAQIRMIRRVLEEVAEPEALQAEFGRLKTGNAPADDVRWLALYEKACEARRGARLARLLARQQRIVFTKHFNMGGSHYA